MKLYRYIRSLIRTSVGVAASLAAQVSFGAAAGRHQVQAQLLDHAELLCANCFFGASDYYYCFAADNKVLIGYQRTPVLNWRDPSKNYLTPVHPGWTAWTAPGQTMPISYDEKHIWVTRAEGRQGLFGFLLGAKEVKLTQSYSRDIFSSNDRCQKAVRAKAR